MDSNKDEAERCTELAERYVREKRFDEAEKFLRKAQKLYPTKKAEGKRAMPIQVSPTVHVRPISLSSSSILPVFLSLSFSLPRSLWFAFARLIRFSTIYFHCLAGK